MIPYFAYQRKRFFDFCLEKFCFSHTFRQEGGLLPQKGTESVENAYYGYGRRAVFRRSAAPARRGAAGHRPPRWGHGDKGGDRPRGAQPPPGQVCHAGNAQRQRAGRAGRRRHRGVRPGAARPFAAGRAGAGAGCGQPPHHRRCPWPAHGAAHPCHHGRGRKPRTGGACGR